MKKARTRLYFFAVLAAALFATTHAKSQQANYFFLPAPIAYPYFEPERSDVKIAADYFTVSGNEIDIAGGGGHGIFRYAANEYLAFDIVGGLYGVSGEVPGFALPFFFSTGFFTPVIEGKGDVSGAGFPFAANLEVQLFNVPEGSLIFFAGPNFGFGFFTIETPYHAVSGATVAQSTVFETKANVFVGGFQMGAQAGIRMGPFRLAPFFMTALESGSASFTFDNGYLNTISIDETGVIEIEPFVVTVYGADLIYEPWNLSLGALFQTTGTESKQLGYDISYFTLAWHFRAK